MNKKEEKNIYQILLERMGFYDESQVFYDLDSDLVEDMVSSLLSDYVNEGDKGYVVRLDQFLPNTNPIYIGFYPPDTTDTDIDTFVSQLFSPLSRKGYITTDIWFIDEKRKITHIENDVIKNKHKQLKCSSYV